MLRRFNGYGIDTLDQRELVVTIEEAIRRGRMEDPGTRDPMPAQQAR